MLDEPHVTHVSAQLAAVIHLNAPRPELGRVMKAGIAELMTAVAAQGIAPIGPVFSRYLRMDPADFDFEVGVPVTTVVAPSGRVKAGRLPAATVAKATYHGPYKGLSTAWVELDQWIAAEGLKPGDDPWEIYVCGLESSPDPADWKTELNRPLTS